MNNKRKTVCRIKALRIGNRWGAPGLGVRGPQERRLRYTRYRTRAAPEIELLDFVLVLAKTRTDDALTLRAIWHYRYGIWRQGGCRTEDLAQQRRMIRQIVPAVTNDEPILGRVLRKLRFQSSSIQQRDNKQCFTIIPNTNLIVMRH